MSPRRHLRDLLFRFIRKAAGSEQGRRIAADSLRGVLQQSPQISPVWQGGPLTPYGDLAAADLSTWTSRRRAAVIITGRFRSGSTFLWNVFRAGGGFTSYYEPLNERRWFDPATRGSRVDSTHKNVDDYWREYEGLTELGKYFRPEWNHRDLYMAAGFHDPDMKRYVEVLIERAPLRPVLQFNRIDFRLPWIRWNFPEAMVLHLYRHPRDQWWSTFLGAAPFPASGRMEDFEPHDKFYLKSWARDLTYHFPFLEERAIEHPYQAFYFIWKLSYLFGKKYAHVSVSYEDIIENPRLELGRLLELLDARDFDFRKVEPLISPPSRGKWRQYAPEDWFRRHETICETVLAEHFGASPARDLAPAEPGRAQELAMSFPLRTSSSESAALRTFTPSAAS